jgi:hypothetical protein
MAELKASEVKYSTPLITKVGGLLLTATHIEFPASAESITGGIELNLAKLGLADEAVLGNNAVAGPEGAVGETASTTQLPFAAWTSGVVVEETTAAKGEAIVKAVPVVLTQEKTKLFLRFLAVVTLKKVWLELTTAEKANATVGLCGCTIFVLGK